MKKTVLKVTLCLAISVLFTACSKDDDNGDAIVPDGRISFDVSIEGSDQDEAASLEADATYEIHHNTNGVRWVAINGLAENIFSIGFRLNMEDDNVHLPSPGTYNLIRTVSFGSLKEKTLRTQFYDYRGDGTDYYGGDGGEVEGTMTITSNDNGIITGSFSFEAYNASENKKAIITNGKFSATNMYPPL